MKKHPSLKKIGQSIRNARKRAGLRQIDVNKKTGLSYRHYQSIEAGEINLTVETLCRLARLFRVPASSFLKDVSLRDCA